MSCPVSSGHRLGFHSLRAGLPLVLLLAGCGGPLSTLDPAGPGAASVAGLWWGMLAMAVLILGGVCALALYAMRGERRGRGLSAGRFVVGWGLVFPVTALAVLLVAALRTGEALLPHPAPEGVVRVEARAHMWWWRFTHYDAEGRPVITANELHIPAGRAVDVHITSADVIHSFWVPRLTGKLDAIPGHENVQRLRADAPGTLAARCAEFCGLQHTQMGFELRVHAPEDYAAALARLAAIRPDPTLPGAARFTADCGTCHSADPRIAGTAPNLASLAQRNWIGGTALRHGGAEDLRTWMRQHNEIKPGSQEPAHGHLDDSAMEEIIAYLESARGAAGSSDPRQEARR